MSEIRIHIDEEGKLSIKNECEVGEEEQSLEEIRKLMEELADVDEIIHLPARESEPQRYHTFKKKKESHSKDRVYERSE